MEIGVLVKSSLVNSLRLMRGWYDVWCKWLNVLAIYVLCA
jgi:hypothetical protein